MRIPRPIEGKGVELVLRSLLFSLGMILSTLIWVPIVLLTFLLAFEKRYRLAQQWSRFNIWWLKETCHIDYQISGLENIPSGPAVIIVKHQSAWETLFLQQLLPPLVWVVKRELLWVPFFGWALAILHPISIDRKAGSSAIKQILRQGQEHLRNGRSVLIFPEGTRTAPGLPTHYSTGGAMLAAHSAYPILPIAHNAGEFWPRRGFLKYPGTVQVVFGPLLDSGGRKPRDLNALVEHWIEGTIRRISEASHSQQAGSAKSGPVEQDSL
jgi:1-acyl-sn-glycerol-3-phosphate acyltransferase